MLVIRKAQLEVIGQQPVEQFIRELTAHIREHLPLQYEALGAEGTREIVCHGIDRARVHRIVSAAGVRAYTQLLFVLGPDFDLNPALPWVRPILAGTEEEPARVEKLITAATDHLRRSAAVG